MTDYKLWSFDITLVWSDESHSTEEYVAYDIARALQLAQRMQGDENATRTKKHVVQVANADFSVTLDVEHRQV